MKHTEGFLKLVNDAKSRIREVSVEEARELLGSFEGDEAMLIDVREDNEWEQGRAQPRHLALEAINAMIKS